MAPKLPDKWNQTVAYLLCVLGIALQLPTEGQVFLGGSDDQRHGEKEGRDECPDGAKERGSGEVRQEGTGVAWVAYPAIGSSRNDLLVAVALDTDDPGEEAVLHQRPGAK